MIQHLKKIKTSIVVAIVFLCLIVTFSSSCNAKLLSVGIDVKMSYDPQYTNEKIQPLSGEITIPIIISAKIRGLSAKFFDLRFKSSTDFSIGLSVKETPAWCTARISPNVVNPIISSQWTSETAYVHISFKGTAPAHVPTIIIIEMDASAKGTLGYVKGVTQTAEISFTPSYLPIIDAVPRSTIKEISPGEIVIFYIDLENLGNAQTEFIFRVTKVPKGWSASIPSNIKVGKRLENQSPKETVELRIQPPFDFGYHNEQEDICIEVYGKYFASIGGKELRSDPYEIIFTVRSRGFSTPGFEALLFLVALIGIILYINYRQKIK
jgi:hypothetical protein